MSLRQHGLMQPQAKSKYGRSGGMRHPPTADSMQFSAHTGILSAIKQTASKLTAERSKEKMRARERDNVMESLSVTVKEQSSKLKGLVLERDQLTAQLQTEKEQREQLTNMFKASTSTLQVLSLRVQELDVASKDSAEADANIAAINSMHEERLEQLEVLGQQQAAALKQYDEDISDKDATIERLRGELDSVTESRAALQQQHDDVTAQHERQSVASAAMATQLGELQEQNTAKDAELAGYIEKTNAAAAEVTQAKATNEQLRASIAASNERAAKLEHELDETKASIAEQDSAIKKHEQTNAELTSTGDELQKKLDDLDATRLDIVDKYEKEKRAVAVLQASESALTEQLEQQSKALADANGKQNLERNKRENDSKKRIKMLEMLVAEKERKLAALAKQADELAELKKSHKEAMKKHEATVKKLEKSKANLIRSNGAAEQKIEDLEEDLQAERDKHAGAKSASKKATTMQKQNRELKEKHNSLLVEMSELKAAAAELKAEQEHKYTMATRQYKHELNAKDTTIKQLEEAAEWMKRHGEKMSAGASFSAAVSKVAKMKRQASRNEEAESNWSDAYDNFGSQAFGGTPEPTSAVPNTTPAVAKRKATSQAGGKSSSSSAVVARRKMSFGSYGDASLGAVDKFTTPPSNKKAKKRKTQSEPRRRNEKTQAKKKRARKQVRRTATLEVTTNVVTSQQNKKVTRVKDDIFLFDG